MKKRIMIAVVVLLILVIVALTFFRSTPFHYSGVAEAVSVDISARLSDTIQEILVEEGSPVTQGQVVARLTCEAANLKKEITQTEFNRAAQLLKTTAGSKENYDLKKHQYDEAALQQSWCTLTSPLTGQVLYKYYEPNEFISAGKKMLTVANLKELDVWVYVPYEELAHLSGKKSAAICRKPIKLSKAAFWRSTTSPNLRPKTYKRVKNAHGLCTA